METTANLLASLKESGVLSKLLKRGLLSSPLANHIAIHESYISFRKKHGKMDSYTFAAEKHGVSIGTVRNVIKFMEG